MDLQAFQKRIEEIFGDQDRARGPALSYLWFVEEVGELAEELRHELRARAAGQASSAAEHQDRQGRLEHEFGDVLAWLCTLASMLDVDMAQAARRYADGCPRCGGTPCVCAAARALDETSA